MGGARGTSEQQLNGDQSCVEAIAINATIYLHAIAAPSAPVTRCLAATPGMGGGGCWRVDNRGLPEPVATGLDAIRWHDAILQVW